MEAVAREDRDLSWLEMFDWFWTEYPRRVGRPAALKAWKAIKPQNQHTIDAIDSGLDRWKCHWTERRFIPHPSTFLNQLRWEDQP